MKLIIQKLIVSAEYDTTETEAIKIVIRTITIPRKSWDGTDNGVAGVCKVVKKSAANLRWWHLGGTCKCMRRGRLIIRSRKRRRRRYRQADETVNHILAECPKLVQKVRKRWHDWIGQRIHWDVCCQFGFNVKEKWYEH